MKHLFIVAAAFMMLAVNAQKIDLDKLRFTTKVKRLPDKFLGEEYKTFAVKVTKTKAVDNALGQPVDDRIGIEGWKRVDGKGHVNIQVNFEDLIIESSTVAERYDVQKDKSGKETGRTYYYKAVVNYSFRATASVINYKTGKDEMSDLLSDRAKKMPFSSSDFSSYEAAFNYFNTNKDELKTKWINEMVAASLAKLNVDLANAFGYPNEPANDILWALDQEKSPEYEPYKAAVETAKTQLTALSPDQNITPDVKALLTPAITYFETMAQKYTDAADKNQKKLRYGAYFNLATIYYYLDDIDNTKKYGDLLIKNDYDGKDGEAFIKYADKLKASFDAHKVNTRHFTFDISSAVAPN